MSTCFAVLNKLHCFFRNGNCPSKWKITVYDAVIRSKLVYGLECIQLQKRLQARLDTFQFKGLEKNIKMETTYVNRENTNKRVFEKANQISNPKNIPENQIKSCFRNTLTITKKLF